MRNLILITTLLFSCFAQAQQYIQKQDRNVINVLANPGFENAKANWSVSVSSTASIVSGTSAIQDSSSLRFTATAASQTVQSALYTMPSTKITETSSECESELRYVTNETTNKYLFRVLDASNTVVSSLTLSPVSVPTLVRQFFVCPPSALLQVISTSGAVKIDLDSAHLGSRKDIIKADVVIALGYEPLASMTATYPVTVTGGASNPIVGLSYQPVATVTASGPLAVTGGASNPVVSLQSSGAVSGASYTSVRVDGFGRITSGSALNSGDVTGALGFFPVASVTASGGLTQTGGASNPAISVSVTGVSSGASFAKVTVDGYGKVTSGNVLIESDIPSLQTTKVTSGIFSVARGGTGIGAYTAGDVLYADTGSSLTRLPIGATGQVLTANAGVPAWQTAGGSGSGANLTENLILNPTFESSPSTGWTTSGSSVASGAYAFPSPANLYYSQITAAVSGGYFQSNVVSAPSPIASGTIELAYTARSVSGTWLASLFSGGSQVASQTITSGTVFTSGSPLYYGVSDTVGVSMTVRFTAVASSAVLAIDNVSLQPQRKGYDTRSIKNTSKYPIAKYYSIINNTNGGNSVTSTNTDPTPWMSTAGACVGTGQCNWNITNAGFLSGTTYWCQCTTGAGAGATSCVVGNTSNVQIQVVTYAGTPTNSSQVFIECTGLVAP